jgi:hypothetical protein
MDINRLIRIANHFDKIGAYTISDEFENKFIRTAAPVDQRNRRSKSVEEGVGRDPLETGSYFLSNVGRFFANLDPRDRAKRQVARQQLSINLLKTWISFFASNVGTDPRYKKYRPYLQDIARNLLNAKTNIENIASPVLEEAKIDNDYKDRILLHRNNFEQVLKEFIQFVDDQDASFSNINFNPYINSLHNTEDAILKLNIEVGKNPPPPPTPAAPSSGGSSSGSGNSAPVAARPVAPTPAAPSSGGSSSGSGNSAPVAARPVAPSGTGQGGGNASSSSGGTQPKKSGGQGGGPSSSTGKAQSSPSGAGGTTGNKPSSKQTSTKPGKSKEDDAGLALSNIVRREYSKAHPKVEDRDILLNMRLVGSFTLKTYYDITKEPSLDRSIRAAIKASPYSQYFRDTMLKIYENKLKAAKEKNEGPTIIKPAAQPDPPKDEPKKDDSKKDDNDPKYKFQCSREGLFIEIKRMDTLSENDPNKYMVDYFPDIKQVIDCHSRLRDKIEHKDNIQLDVLINILESKYFSLINKTQFPY